MNTPTLAVFEARLDKALSNLVKWEVLSQGLSKPDELYGSIPTPLKFNDSMILFYEPALLSQRSLSTDLFSWYMKSNSEMEYKSQLVFNTLDLYHIRQ